MSSKADRLFSRWFREAKDEFGYENVLHNKQVDEAEAGSFAIADQGIQAIDFVDAADDLVIVGGGNHPEHGDIVTVKVRKLEAF